MTPAASIFSSSLRRLFSPPRLVWAISARTTTPRATAASSAFSSSGRSNRKIRMSILVVAWRTACTSGVRPSSGWIIRSTGVAACGLLGLAFLLRPFDGGVTLGIQLQDGIRHTVGPHLERHLHIVADLLIRGRAQLELQIVAAQDLLELRPHRV